MATPQKGAVRKVAATPEKTTSPVKSPDQKKSKTGHNNGNESEVVPSNLESALEAAVPGDPPNSSDGTPEASRLHLQYISRPVQL